MASLLWRADEWAPGSAHHLQVPGRSQFSERAEAVVWSTGWRGRLYQSLGQRQEHPCLCSGPQGASDPCLHSGGWWRKRGTPSVNTVYDRVVRGTVWVRRLAGFLVILKTMNTVASDNIFLKILEAEGDDIRYQGLFLLKGSEGESPLPLCTMALVVSDCAVASVTFTLPYHTVPTLYLLTLTEQW